MKKDEPHPYKSSGLEESGVRCIEGMSSGGAAGISCGKALEHPIHGLPIGCKVDARCFDDRERRGTIVETRQVRTDREYKITFPENAKFDGWFSEHVVRPALATEDEDIRSRAKRAAKRLNAELATNADALSAEAERAERLESSPFGARVLADTERAERRPGRGYQGKIESLTVRMAVAIVQLERLRGNVRAPVIRSHDDRSYFRQLIDEIQATLTVPAETEHDRIRKEAFAAVRASANTLPKERTGIRQRRTTAALADVADLRRELNRVLDYTGTGVLAALDRIEQALRAGGAA